MSLIKDLSFFDGFHLLAKKTINTTAVTADTIKIMTTAAAPAIIAPVTGPPVSVTVLLVGGPVVPMEGVVCSCGVVVSATEVRGTLPIVVKVVVVVVSNISVGVFAGDVVSSITVGLLDGDVCSLTTVEPVVTSGVVTVLATVVTGTLPMVVDTVVVGGGCVSGTGTVCEYNFAL